MVAMGHEKDRNATLQIESKQDTKLLFVSSPKCVTNFRNLFCSVTFFCDICNFETVLLFGVKLGTRAWCRLFLAHCMATRTTYYEGSAQRRVFYHLSKTKLCDAIKVHTRNMICGRPSSCRASQALTANWA